MILDEKTLLNPPPPYCSPRLGHANLNNPFYETAGSDTASIITIGSNNPYAAYLSARPEPTRPKATFSSLPSHLLLHILYCTFPNEDGQFEGDFKAVRQRRTLHWLETSLRLVNRELYIVSMHILRSVYLTNWDSMIRPPYSSEPFPSSNSLPSVPAKRNSPYDSSSTLFPLHRELRILDLFIAVLAHEELLYDTSSLHLSRHEAYKDIFEMMQPRARLEDLVADFGSKAGLIILGDSDGHSIPDTPTTPPTPQIPSDAKEKENSPYAVKSSSTSSSPTISPQASTSSLSKPLKKSKSTFSMFSAFSSFGKGKGKALAERPLPQAQQIHRRPISLTPLPFESLSISFSTRKVGLMYAPVLPHSSSRSSLTVTGSSSAAYGGSTYGALSVSSRRVKKTIVEVAREKDEALEVCARRLIRGLREWMEEEAQ